jgi:hypothetical protein
MSVVRSQCLTALAMAQSRCDECLLVFLLNGIVKAENSKHKVFIIWKNNRQMFAFFGRTVSSKSQLTSQPKRRLITGLMVVCTCFIIYNCALNS